MSGATRVLGIAAVAVAATAATIGAAPEQRTSTPDVGVLDEHPAIQYAGMPTRDRVSLLDRAIREGTASLEFRGAGGYLEATLDALKISPESQLLVFSKTGVQRAATGPANPRAIYFDDSVVVGYIPGAQYLELATQDPEQGVVFYTIEQQAAAAPSFTRRIDCLTCHVSATTLEVPGMIARSNFMNASGVTLPQLGGFTVDHRTPIANRWGGWFVTGNYDPGPYAGVAHMGNVTIVGEEESLPKTTSNEVLIQWLNSTPETRGYLSGESDIAALMIFDHQMHAVNLLTKLSWETRVAAREGHPDFARGTLGPLVEELTDYLLFAGEAPPLTRIAPRRGFAEWFTSGAPRDRLGRSLRDLDLHTRLLRYECSYMIYTAAFESLPAGARLAVFDRMWGVLSGRDTRPEDGHLSADDRRAIVEILRDTKSDLPQSFRAGA